MDLRSVPTMKLLVIGHSYLTPFAQSKYVAMKRLDPSLQLRIVTPPEIGHVFMRYRHSRHPGLTPGETVVIPTVVGQTHMTYLIHPPRLWNILRRFEPDHIHIEEDPHSLIGVETVSLARLACPKATISFFIWDNLAREPRFPLNILKRVLTRYSLTYTSIVVCGNTEAECLLKSVKGYLGRTAVLPQVGIDPEDYDTPPSAQVRALLPVVPGEPWIGFIGRFTPEKGLRILLEALVQLQHLPWRLLLVGEGPLMNDVWTYWQPLFGARLLCLEAVPHKDVPEYLKCLDIFVLPSYSTEFWKEQFGLTLAQAMLAGVACIGSSSGAIPEVLGSAGMIVPEKDVTALAQALENLLRSEPTRRTLGDKARAIALQRYTNISIAKCYLEVFHAAASQPNVGIRQHA